MNRSLISPRIKVSLFLLAFGLVCVVVILGPILYGQPILGGWMDTLLEIYVVGCVMILAGGLIADKVVVSVVALVLLMPGAFYALAIIALIWM